VDADAEVEADESFLVNLSNVSGATLSTSQVRVTIANDDITVTSRGGKGSKRQPKGNAAIASATSLALEEQNLVAMTEPADPVTGIGPSSFSSRPLDEEFNGYGGQMLEPPPQGYELVGSWIPFPGSEIPAHDQPFLPFPFSEQVLPPGLLAMAPPWLDCAEPWAVGQGHLC
jgi:hypothetical protein